MSTRDPLPEDFEPDVGGGETDDELRERLKLRVRDLLDAGGALSAHVSGFEERPQQLAMADAVVDALVDRNTAVIEAGTGTGKTLAYLAPAILSGKKVVVSTATKALQEQLVDKDLPLLHELGLEFRHAVMKGRSNYLCLLRYEQFDQAPVFVSRAELDDYQRLRAWARGTLTGDRAELELPDAYVAWRDVSSTTETCLGQECPRFSDCHVTKMRQRAQEADVVVVNHHLFFADLALRQSPAAKVGVEVVPRAEAVVFDEAHNIEEVATEFFGAQLSNYRFFDLCRDVDRLLKVRSSWPGERLTRLTGGLGRSAETYFRAIAALQPNDAGPMRAPKVEPPKAIAKAEPPRALSLFDRPREVAASDDEVKSRAIVLDTPPELDLAAERRDARWSLEPGALQRLNDLRDELLADLAALKDLLTEIGGEEPEAEIEGFLRRCDDLRLALEVLSNQATPGLVYWAEQRGRGVFLRASPVDVAGELGRALFADERPIVLTSATLATAGQTNFFQRRIGLTLSGSARETVLASPFDYARQAALYFPKHLPEPASQDFLDAATTEIAALVALAQGRTFALFTSLRAMREVHARLKDRIPYRVLLQGERPKGALVKAFREEPSVLFATQSFWEGVDVPGDALSLVIIDKLPFASPGDPLVAARLKAIDDRGGSSFSEYSLPAAAISLKQGFGRLIRSRQDTGAVAILDRRLWTKSYGAFFRKSLPACPTFSAFGDLKRWWRETRADEG